MEKVSRMMDGDLSPNDMASLLRSCAANPAVKDSWSAYHLIGDCLRSDAAASTALDGSTALTARICAALDSEPNLLVPAAAKAVRERVAGYSDAADEDEYMSAPRQAVGMAHVHAPAWRSWAVAASVATVAVVGWQAATSSWRGNGALNGPAVAVTAPAVAPQAVPVANAVASTEPTVAVLKSATLDRYLQAHSEVAPPTRLSGSSVYVQSVAYRSTH